MKICIFGNKLSTKNLINHLIKNNVNVSCLVILNIFKAEKIEISGFDNNLSNFANQNNIKVYNAKAYSLKDKFDKSFFQNENFDLGLCTGWQRLIPVEILDTFKFGIFGWHGSGFQFPNGRGRSPLNWSIRLGLKKIYHNCFKYSNGIDNGDIFDTKEIEIIETDYIFDLQNKCLDHILDSSIQLIQNILNNKKLDLVAQTEHPHIVFPSLNESSGQIFLNLMNSKLAMQIIRSCSKPFPGAYVVFKSKKYRIWEASICKKKELTLNETNEVFIKKGYLYIKLKDGLIKSNNFEVK